DTGLLSLKMGQRKLSRDTIRGLSYRWLTSCDLGADGLSKAGRITSGNNRHVLCDFLSSIRLPTVNAPCVIACCKARIRLSPISQIFATYEFIEPHGGLLPLSACWHVFLLPFPPPLRSACSSCSLLSIRRPSQRHFYLAALSSHSLYTHVLRLVRVFVTRHVANGPFCRGLAVISRSALGHKVGLSLIVHVGGSGIGGWLRFLVLEPGEPSGSSHAVGLAAN
ncbi:unnamed protein product, partial [Pleuronectes platessa]